MQNRILTFHNICNCNKNKIKTTKGPQQTAYISLSVNAPTLMRWNFFKTYT